MKVKRRSFLAALASLPFIGRLCPDAWREPEIVRFRLYLNELEFSDWTHITGAVNSTKWLGWPARYWRCNGFQFERLVDNTWEIVSEFQRGEPVFIAGRPVYLAVEFNDRYFGERIT